MSLIFIRLSSDTIHMKVVPRIEEYMSNNIDTALFQRFQLTFFLVIHRTRKVKDYTLKMTYICINLIYFNKQTFLHQNRLDDETFMPK